MMLIQTSSVPGKKRTDCLAEKLMKMTQKGIACILIIKKAAITHVLIANENTILK